MMQVPDYPWFGPRHGMGWGWAPVSWEGQAVLVIFIVLLGFSYLRFRSSRTFLYLTAGLTVLLLMICAVTGTKPGLGLSHRSVP